MKNKYYEFKDLRGDVMASFICEEFNFIDLNSDAYKLFVYLNKNAKDSSGVVAVIDSEYFDDPYNKT